MSSLDTQYIADLVLQAQEGSSNAFAELFAATYQKQYAFAFSCLHEDFAAQRALQNAYTQALGSGQAYSMRQLLTLPFSEAQTLLLRTLCSMRVGAIASLLEMPGSDVRRYIASGKRRILALSALKGGDGA